MNHLNLGQNFWLKKNDESHGVYTIDSQIKFKISMVSSSLYDYSDAYILASGTVSITGTGADDHAKRLDERNKGVIFKNCAPFTDCVSEINNAQIVNTKDLDVMMPMYYLTKYINYYLTTSGSLWQYYWDDLNDNIVNYELFKFKIYITGKTPSVGNEKDVNGL